MKKLSTLLMITILLVATKSIAAQDTTPPVIIITQDTLIQVGEMWTLEDPTAIDNITPDNQITINWNGGSVDSRTRGTYPILITAPDLASNTAKRTVQYIVDDFIAPVIDIRTTDTVCHQVNTTYNSTAATATDNYYAASQVSLVLTGVVDAYTPGLYEETFIATDGSGNKDTVIRYVRVGDCNTNSNLNITQGSLLLYPNPAKKHVSIKGLKKKSIVKIMTMNGKVLRHYIIDNNTPYLDVSAFKNGIYLITLETNQKTKTGKITILH